MAIALGIVIAFGAFWLGATLFMSWQKDAPTATGLGGVESGHYRENVENRRRSLRKQAMFFRRTLWPVLFACIVTICILAVLLAQ